MEKLKRIHVIGGAIGAALLIAAAVYFGVIKKVNLEIETTIASITSAMGTIRQGASDADEVEPVFADAMQKAEKELKEAQAEFRLSMLQYDDFKQRYRKITFRSKDGTYDDVFPQLLAEYRDRLIPDFVQFVELHECTLTQIPDLGMPPSPPIAFPRSALLPIPDSGAVGAAAGGFGGGFGGGLGDPGLGGGFGGGGGGGGPLNLTVHGTYGSVATLIKRLPTFSRLCLIGPVTLRNLDPVTEQVEASFTITFYLVADGPPEVVKAALTGGGGAAPAADPNAPPGGVPGDPGTPGSPGSPGGAPGPAGS